MADRIFIRHIEAMKNTDPFVEGLRRIFEAQSDLKPAAISVAAGLDDSTIRKLLRGTNASPRVDTAQRIAQQIGLHLSDIIAIGEHEDPANAVAILLALREVTPAIRDEAVKYAQYLQSQQLAYHAGRLPELPQQEQKVEDSSGRAAPQGHLTHQDEADDAPPRPGSRRRSAS